MRITITKAGRTDDYGSALVLGTQYDVPDALGASLVAAGFATDTYAVLAAQPNSPFVAGTVAAAAGVRVSPGPTIPANTAATRYSKKYRPGVSKLLIVGDSYAAGSGASVAANAFAEILKARYAGKLVMDNYGISGRPLSSYGLAPCLTTGATPAGRVQIDPGDVVCGVLGLNDLRGVDVSGGTAGCGPGPDNFPYLQTKVLAFVAQWLVPESAKIRLRNQAQTALNPGMTFSVAFTESLNGNASAAYTNSAGAYFQCTTPKGDLIIISFLKDSTASGNWTITIDGTAYPVVSSIAKYDTWSQTAIAIRVPTTSTHVVRVTNTSGVVLAAEWVSCVDTSTDFGATLVYSAPTYLNDGVNIGWGQTGFTVNSPTANALTGSAAYALGNGGCDRFGESIIRAMNYCSGLGFNIVLSHARVGFEAASMIGVDTIHPNDAGHFQFAKSFADGIDSLLAFLK